LRNIVALRALYALVILLFLIPTGITAETTIITGAKFNDGQIFGVFGTMQSLSDRFAQFTQADLGGEVVAGTSLTLVRFPISDKLRFFLLIGPNFEIVELDPDPQLLSTYLMAATGLGASYKITDAASIWTAYQYLMSDAPISPHKIGAGLSLSLH